MIKRFLNIFIFAIIAPFLLAQQNRMSLQDILSFKRDSVSGKLMGWLGASPLNLKTMDTVEGQGLVDVTDTISVSFVPSQKDVNFSITTGFLMPIIGNIEKMEASFSGMNKGLDDMQLIFTGYNARGEVVSIDTLKIAETKGWNTFMTTLFIKNVSYMHLLLNIHGSHNNIMRAVGLDKIQFIADGKNLIEFPQCNLYEKLVPDIDYITKLSFGCIDSYQRISPLKNKKILAIGESLHGSETLSESAIEIMKSRILHNNCKLVLLEIPFEKMLSVNRFVLGDERFTLDLIANSLELGLYSNKLLDFFKWVKEYNRYAERKVRVLGLDTPSTDVIGYPMDIFNYFYLMNKPSISESLRQFLLLFLSNCRKAMKDVFSSIKNDINFKKNSDVLELKIIEHWWNDWLTNVTSQEQLQHVRDSLMYRNIKYMIELLCEPSECVTLYSHLEHACRDKMHTISRFPLMSYGALLKENYGAEYSVIGLFAYGGRVLHFPSVSKQVNNKPSILDFANNILVNTEENYLESILSKLDNSYFYIPSFQLSQSQMYIKIGTNSKVLTNIIYPPHYMDGVIYLKESKVMHVVHDDISLKEKYINLLKRFDLCRSLIENTVTDK